MKSAVSLLVAIWAYHFTFAFDLRDSSRWSHPESKLFISESGEPPTRKPPEQVKGLPLYFSITAAFGISETTVQNLNGSLSAKNKFSYGIGADAVFFDGFTGRLPVGLYYQTAGLSIVDLQYVKVPLQYQFYIDKVKRLFAGGGGYAGYLVGSGQSGANFELDNLNNSDYGAMASAGYWLTLNKYDNVARLIVQFNAQWGMKDIDSSPGASLNHNRLYYFTISYTPGVGRSNRLPRFGPIIKR